MWFGFSRARASAVVVGMRCARARQVGTPRERVRAKSLSFFGSLPHGWHASRLERRPGNVTVQKDVLKAFKKKRHLCVFSISSLLLGSYTVFRVHVLPVFHDF